MPVRFSSWVGLLLLNHAVVGGTRMRARTRWPLEVAMLAVRLSTALQMRADGISSGNCFGSATRQAAARNPVLVAVVTRTSISQKRSRRWV